MTTSPEPRLRSADLVGYEAAGDNDRRWFAGHPDRSYRLRPITGAERAVLKAPAATHTLVRQVRPGFRLRKAVLIAGTIPDADPVLERFDREGVVYVGGGGGGEA